MINVHREYYLCVRYKMRQAIIAHDSSRAKSYESIIARVYGNMYVCKLCKGHLL